MKRFARLVISTVLPLLALVAPVSVSLTSGHVVHNVALAITVGQCPDGSDAPDGNKANCSPAQNKPAPIAAPAAPTCDQTDGSTSCVYFGGGYVGNCQVRPTDAGCKTAADAVNNGSGTNCVTLSIPVFAGSNKVCDDGNRSVIVVYLILILRLLAGLVGAVVVLMLIIGGIQYITSAGDPGAVKSAKSRITNALTALVLFLLMYAILSFLIPGGIFS